MTKPDFSFETTENKEEKYRAGTIKVGNKTYETPSLILYTKEGSPVNLTKDLLNNLPHEKTHSLQLLFSDLYQFKDVLEKFGKGSHEFLSLQEHLLFLLIRDSSYFNEQEFGEDSISVTTRKGKTKVTIDEYIKVVKMVKPDVVTTLSLDLAWESSKKRAVRISNATNQWLTKFMESDVSNYTNTFGVVQGGKYDDLRNKSIEELLKYTEKLSGYILSGFGTGETNKERNEVIKNTIVSIFLLLFINSFGRAIVILIIYYQFTLLEQITK
ncbi:hypothetical protein DICPUDRAFT_37187 [Dictyostelium purpureum]|uniref:tRNA-guanine(15) transglycosylase-like domain-containing protein n=1 Tax=Dictyostelium purpureum TaxID=5786 RepID=F0ZSC0_DICPU|nr:uncharacterized protein DICPUDRAFT_37187 [Dictyostelium purpureum]EGC33154.1 hypothetical protein DICPUDRAFT_37187 [Dictyostelium purpureum]|eukprot:XP_003290310.1 hypothetical protein DICPUDRAFT_37187 [Dictyostelium purpureum]